MAMPWGILHIMTRRANPDKGNGQEDFTHSLTVAFPMSLVMDLTELFSF